MKMKKVLAVFMAIAMMIAVMTACSDSDDPSSGSSSNGGSTSSSTSPDSTDPDSNGGSDKKDEENSYTEQTTSYNSEAQINGILKNFNSQYSSKFNGATVSLNDDLSNAAGELMDKFKAYTGAVLKTGSDKSAQAVTALNAYKAAYNNVGSKVNMTVTIDGKPVKVKQCIALCQTNTFSYANAINAYEQTIANADYVGISAQKTLTKRVGTDGKEHTYYYIIFLFATVVE